MSLLKPLLGDLPSVIEPIPENPSAFTSQPSAITDFRWRQANGTKVYEVLVEWTNTSREDATWESWTDLLELFPNSNLEDKVIFPSPG